MDPKSGGQKWIPKVAAKSGFQKRRPKVDPKSGDQKRTPKVAAKSGPKKWRSKKDPKSGGQKWTPKVAVLVLLYASVERFDVSRMRDFFNFYPPKSRQMQ